MAQQQDFSCSADIEDIETQALKYYFKLNNELSNDLQRLLLTSTSTELKPFFQEKVNAIISSNSIEEIGDKMFGIKLTAAKPDHYHALYQLILIEPQLRTATANKTLMDVKFALITKLKECCQQKLNENFKINQQLIEQNYKKNAAFSASLESKQSKLQVCSQESAHEEFKRLLNIHLASPFIFESKAIREELFKKESLPALLTYLLLYTAATEFQPLTDFIQKVPLHYTADEFTGQIMPLIREILQPVNVNRNKGDKSLCEISGNHVLLNELFKEHASLLADATIEEIRITAKGTLYLNEKLITLSGKNIVLVASKIHVLSSTEIDTSGQNAQPAFPADTPAASHGKERRAFLDVAYSCDGEPGKNGNAGQSAGNIYIQTHDFVGQKLLSLKLNGGKGSDGQKGGDGDQGKIGKDGKDGSPDKQPSHFTRGASLGKGTSGNLGEQGGNGGHGGLGGLGGWAGEVTIKIGDETHIINEKNPCTLELSVECAKGEGGKQGINGAGGDGGINGKEGVDHGVAWRGYFFGINKIEARGKLVMEETYPSIFSLQPPAKFIVLKTANEVTESINSTALKGNETEIPTEVYAKRETPIKKEFKLGEFQQLQQQSKNTHAQKQHLKTQEMKLLESEISDINKQISFLKAQEIQLQQLQHELTLLHQEFEKSEVNLHQQILMQQTTASTTTQTLTEFKEIPDAHEKHYKTTLATWRTGHSRSISSTLNIKEIKKRMLDELIKPSMLSLSSKPYPLELEDKLSQLWKYLTQVKKYQDNDADSIVELLEAAILSVKISEYKDDAHIKTLVNLIEEIESIEQFSLNKTLHEMTRFCMKQPHPKFTLDSIFHQLINDKKLTDEQLILAKKNIEDIYQLLLSTCKEMIPGLAVKLLHKATAVDESKNPSNPLSQLMHDLPATFFEKLTGSSKINELQKLRKNYAAERAGHNKSRNLQDFPIESTTPYRHFFKHHYSLKDYPFEEAADQFNGDKNAKNLIAILYSFATVCDRAIAEGKHGYRLQGKNSLTFLTIFEQNIQSIKFTASELAEIVKACQHLIAACHSAPTMAFNFYRKLVNISYAVDSQLQLVNENNRLLEHLINTLSKETDIILLPNEIINIQTHLESFDKCIDPEKARLKKELIEKLSAAYRNNKGLVNFLIHKTEFINEASVKLFLKDLDQHNSALAQHIKQYLLSLDTSLNSSNTLSNKNFIRLIEYLSTHIHEMGAVATFQPFINHLQCYFEFTYFSADELKEISAIAVKHKLPVRLNKMNHSLGLHALDSLYSIYQLARVKYKENILKSIDREKSPDLLMTTEACLEQIDAILNSHAQKDTYSAQFHCYNNVEKCVHNYHQGKISETEFRYYFYHLSSDINTGLSLVKNLLPSPLIDIIKLMGEDTHTDLIATLQSVRIRPIEYPLLVVLTTKIKEIVETIPNNTDTNTFVILQMLEEICCNKMQTHITHHICKKLEASDVKTDIYNSLEARSANYIFEHIHEIHQFHTIIDQDSTAAKSYDILLTTFDKLDPTAHLDLRTAYLFEICNIPWTAQQTCLEVIQHFLHTQSQSEQSLVTSKILFLLTHLAPNDVLYENLMKIVQNNDLPYSNIQEMRETLINNYYQQILSKTIHSISEKITARLNDSDTKATDLKPETLTETLTETFNELLFSYSCLNFQQQSFYFAKFLSILDLPNIEVKEVKKFKEDLCQDIATITANPFFPTLETSIKNYNANASQATIFALFNECITLMQHTNSQQLWYLEEITSKIIKQFSHLKINASDIDQLRHSCMLLQQNTSPSVSTVQHLQMIHQNLSEDINRLNQRYFAGLVEQKSSQHSEINNVLNTFKQDFLKKISIDIEHSHEADENNPSFISICANLEKMERFFTPYPADISTSTRRMIYDKLLESYSGLKSQKKFVLKNSINQLEATVAKLCQEFCIATVLPKFKFTNSADIASLEQIKTSSNETQLATLFAFFKDFYYQSSLPNWEENLIIFDKVFTALFTTVALPYQKMAVGLHKFLENELTKPTSALTNSARAQLEKMNRTLQPLIFSMADEELDANAQENKQHEEATQLKFESCQTQLCQLINKVQRQIEQLERDTGITIPLHLLMNQLKSEVIDKVQQLSLQQIDEQCHKLVREFWSCSIYQVVVSLQSSHTSVPQFSNIDQTCNLETFISLTKQWCKYVSTCNTSDLKRDIAWIRGTLSFLSFNFIALDKQKNAMQLAELFTEIVAALSAMLNPNLDHSIQEKCLPELTLMIHQIFIIKENAVLAFTQHTPAEINQVLKSALDKINQLITALPALDDGYIMANYLLDVVVKLLNKQSSPPLSANDILEVLDNEMSEIVSRTFEQFLLKPKSKTLSTRITDALEHHLQCIENSQENCEHIIHTELNVVLHCLNLSKLTKLDHEKVLILLERLTIAIHQHCSKTQSEAAVFDRQLSLLNDSIITTKQIIYNHFENVLSGHEKALLKRLLSSSYSGINYTTLNPLGKQDAADNAVMNWLLSSKNINPHHANKIPESLKKEGDTLQSSSSNETLVKYKENLAAFYEPLLTAVEHTHLLQILHNLRTPDQFTELFNIFHITSPDTWLYHLQLLAMNTTHDSITSAIAYSYVSIEKALNEIKTETQNMKIQTLDGNDVSKDLWRLFNHYEYDETSCNSLLSYINTVLEKTSGNAKLSEQAIFLKKQIQKMIKIKYQFNKASCFAEEGDYIDHLYHLINTIIQKNSAVSLLAGNDEIFREVFSEILSECEHKEITRKIIEIVTFSQPKQWKEKIYSFQLNDAMDIFFNTQNDNSSDKNFRHNAAALLPKIRSNLPLIHLLAKKLRLENKLLDNRANISAHLLLEILQFLNEITVDHDLLNTLQRKSLSQWKTPLRCARFGIVLATSTTENDPARKQCITLLIHLEKRYGETVVNQLLNILALQKIDYAILMIVLDNFNRAEYIFDSEALIKIEKKPISQWQNILKEHTTSSQAKIRDLNELLKLIKIETNESNAEEMIKTHQSLLEYLAKKIDDTNTALKKPAPLDNFSDLPVNQWDAAMVKAWSKRLKEKDNRIWIKNNLPHIVAVISHAVKLSKLSEGHYPRETQLLALWSFIEASEREKGRLGQIATGEGKTVITAMFALIKALSGERVDIITSSSVLAERDASANKELFEMFEKITVANNCDETCQKDSSKRSERYKATIVYGDVGSFQRDFLLTDFHGQPILGDRKNTTLLVDEVDSMLIDKSENMLYLSHDIADLRHLRHIYIKIWELVNAYNIDQYSRAERIDIVTQHVKRALDNKLLSIPTGLKEFVDQRLSIWIKSAFAAKNMKLKGPYITSTQHNKLKKDKIIVMDNDTGVEQLQTQWSNGLHQFLQLKHTQEISDESLKAVFISNISYFKNYTNRLYGLTGTLGSTADRELLKQMYQVDFFQLPRFKANLYVEENGIVTIAEHSLHNMSEQPSYGNDQISSKGWFNVIEDEIKLKTEGENARAVLVICEDVDSVHNLVEHMKKTCPNKKLHVYETAYGKFDIGKTKDDAVKPGDIIIATNLAGRGTDLHTSDALDKRGGLHVVLSYLPSNTRIEEQAFGRTARQGKRGSGKFIILSKNKPLTIEQLKAKRDEVEQNKIDKIRMHNLQAILLEEELFKSFTTLYKNVRHELESKFKLVHGNNYIAIQLKSLCDHWAFWIDSMSDKIRVASSALDKTAIHKEFAHFEKDILDQSRQDNIFKLVSTNHELIKLGHHFLSARKHTFAQQCFDQVIQSDNEFSEIAHYYKAYIIANKNDLTEIKHRKTHYKHLAQARRLIKKRIDEITASSEIVSTIAAVRKAQGHAAFDNEYQEQAEHEISLLNVHLRAIDAAIGNEISEESFTDEPKFKDKEKSKKIFNQLRLNSKIFKDFRLSKKVSYKSDNQALHVAKDGSDTKVELPSEYLYCKTEILAYFNTLISKKNAIAADRSINEIAFVPFVTSKIALWELLKTHGMLQENSQQEWMIFNPDQALKKLDLSKFGDSGKAIHVILCRNLHKKFDRSLLPNIEDQTYESILKILKEKNIIKNMPCGDLKLVYESSTQTLKLPSPLEKYRNILCDLVQAQTHDAVNSQTIIQAINIEDLPLRETQEEASRALWHYLISQNIIKPCHINFPLALSTSSSQIERKINEIENQLKIEIEKLYGKDGLEDCEPILDILKRAIGKLKMVQRLNVNFQNLDQYFLKGDYPPELEIFTKIIFDQVICFEEKPSYWNWHAFAVAMFGLAQIITGVILEVFSVGIGTYFSAILISEGISDIIFAIQSGLSNSFTWKQYGMHKLISVACTTLTLGLCPPGVMQVPQAAKDTLLGFARYAGIRFAQESVKAVSFGVAGFVIDKALSILPYEMNVQFGQFLREQIGNSTEIKTSIQQLKTTMAELLSLSNVSDTIKHEIHTEMLEILNPKQTWTQDLLNIVEGFAKQLPDSVLCAKSLSLKDAVGTGGAFLIDEAVKLIFQAGWSAGKCYALVNQLVSNFNKLNEKLKSKIDTYKQQQTAAVINPLSSENQKYIDNFIETQRNELVNMITRTISDEFAKPLVNRSLFRAMNQLNDAWSEVCHKAAGCESKEELLTRTLRNAPPITDDTPETQARAARTTQTSQRFEEVSTDIVPIDTVDPATTISNIEQTTLNQAIETSGKENLKLYKNANGDYIVQESSRSRFIRGSGHSKPKSKNQHKSHHKKHHHKSKNEGHAHSHSHRSKHHHKPHQQHSKQPAARLNEKNREQIRAIDRKTISAPQQESHHHRHHHHHHRHHHHHSQYARDKHLAQRHSHTPSALTGTRSANIAPGDPQSLKAPQREVLRQRTFEDRNHPARHFARNTLANLENGYSQRVAVASRIHDDSLPQALFSQQTLDTVCNLAKTTTRIANQQIDNFYQHRIRAIEIEILKDKIASYNKLKQLREQNKQEEETFIAKQRANEIEFMKSELEKQLKEKTDELDLLEEKIKAIVHQRIKNIDAKAANDNEIYALIKSELEAMKALNTHVPCGGKSTGKLSDSITKILQDLESSLAGIDPVKIKLLKQLADEIRPLKQNQSNLEEQLKILLSAQSLAKSGEVTELENAILQHKIPIHFQHFLPSSNACNLDEYGLDMNDTKSFITQTNFLSGSNYQLSELFKSNTSALSSFANVFEAVCKIVETKYLFDTARIKIKTKETERAIAKTKAEKSLVIEPLKAAGKMSSMQHIAKETTLDRKEEEDNTLKREKLRKQKLEAARHQNEKIGKLHMRQLEAEHAEHKTFALFNGWVAAKQKSNSAAQQEQSQKGNHDQMNTHQTPKP